MSKNLTAHTARHAATALLALTTTWIHAQAKDAPSYAASGPTLEGAPWQTSEQAKGKVLMVFYYSTACVPCLQKMPELRANAAGWRSKPFELVLINVDPKREDALAYTLAVRQVEPNSVRFVNLWAGDPQFRDNLGERPKKLPLTLVLDMQGKVRARHEGRIAPEAWDDVAELLP
jgi:thiol-disulfide isomerase/thioredoxin